MTNVIQAEEKKGGVKGSSTRHGESGIYVCYIYADSPS